MNTGAGIAIVLAVILVLVLVLCAWLWWRHRRAPQAAAPRDTVLQLQPGVFARALRTLHPRDADHRYDKPCVLVCGGPASGKTELLRAAGLEPVPAAEGVDSGWWRSPEGVAFELPSNAWELDGGAWTGFLRLVERHRSERALDAVVWTIPYAHAAEDAVDGERMYRKLGELQDRLGLSLPVYVVVTGCEGAAGFPAWAALLPAGAQAQTLGWSNPHPPGTPWRRELGETALGTLVQRLRRLVSALAARHDPGEHGAAIFLMPERIGSALAGLPAALHAAMRPNAVLTPFSLRGIYLSGRALAPAQAIAAPADPFAAPPPAPPAGTPLFCRALFAERVFGEFGLAQPVARRVAADRRARRIVLAASALVAAAWTIALVPTWLSLERQLETMRAPLLGMHKAILDARRDIRIDERATIELLSGIDRVPDWDTRRAALPLSWFACCGGLERDIQSAFRGYYERVLFESLDEAFEERSAQLTAHAPAATAGTALFGAPERMAEFAAMREFVDATLEYEYQHARFQTLAGVQGGSWQDATTLFSYLFGLRLHPGTTRSVALFDRAVRDSSLSRTSERRHDNARFRNHLRVLHRAWLERLFGATELAALQRELVRGVRALAANPRAEGAELAALQADIGKLRTLLARTDVAWMADGRLAQGEAYRGLDARIRKSHLLGPALAGQLADETAARQGAFRSSVDADSSGATPVLAYAEGKQLLVNEDLAGLEEALGRLLQHPFAQGALDAQAALPDSAVPWTWTDARLQAARAAAADLQAYEAAELAKAPPAYQEALRRLARSQAANLVERELSAAVLPAQCDARWRCANFDDARTHLVPLLAELRKLELGAAAERWRGLLDRQAAALVRSTAAAADAAKLYLPEPGAAAGWDGSRGAALAAYGLEGAAELPDYLESQLNVLAELAGASKGARAWLAQDGGGAPFDARPLLAEWAGIDAELARRAAKTPGGPLQKLETWLGTDVAELDSVNCAARMVRGTGGADYFGRRLARAAATFRPRCLALQSSVARAGFGAIAGHFDTHLAGRYPFAANVDAAPADPDQVRQLLVLLERHLPGTRGPLARQKDPRSSAAVAFLDRLDATRPLLGAMLAEDPAGGVSALDLWPQFRLNRAREKGADQIIEWSVDAGDTLAPPAAGGMPGVAWRVGQPITLRLRWAKNSEVTPVADTARPAMRVEGRSASWHYDDPWALLRVLRAHAAPLSELGEREARQPTVLRFAVPTRDAGGKPSDAVAYARLAVARHGKAEALPVPAFPSSAAPPLPATFSEQGSAP